MQLKAWLTTVFICLSIIIALAIFKKNETDELSQKNQSISEYSVSIETNEAEIGSYQETITIIGDVVIPKNITIHNEMPGVINKVNFLSGGKVNKGDIIIELNATTELSKIKAAKAKEVLLNSTFIRTKKLRDNNAVSAEKFDKANAELIIIKSEIEELNDIIQKKIIKAPFYGNLGIHSLKVGEFLEKNSKVVSITGINKYVWVDFYIPHIYSMLEVDDKILVSPIRNINNDDNINASIVAIDNAITKNIRSRKYRAIINSPSIRLDANTALKVYAPINPPITSIIVANISILQDVNGSYVYKIIKDNLGSTRAYRQNIEILSSNDKFTYVKNGLVKGDIVASLGAYKLFEGILVNIIQPEHSTKNNYPLSGDGV